MLIRSPIPTDRNKILYLLKARKTFNDRELQVAMDVFDDALSQIRDHDYLVFCALDEKEHLTGYICYGPNTMTDSNYDIYWIAVDKQYGQQGVGSKLLSFAEVEIAHKGGGTVYIETSSTEPYEPARSFYKKHGYKVASILENFYRPGDHKLIFMKEITACDIQENKIE
jgi:ribosomal protein S18 acetylase RimI-like enzyme